MSLIYNGKDYTSSICGDYFFYDINCPLDIEEFIVKYLKDEIKEDEFSIDKCLVDTTYEKTSSSPSSMEDYIKKIINKDVSSFKKNKKLNKKNRDIFLNSFLESELNLYFKDDLKIRQDLDEENLGTPSSIQIDCCKQMIAKVFKKEFGSDALLKNNFPLYKDSELDLVEVEELLDGKKKRTLLNPKDFFFFPRYNKDINFKDNLLQSYGIHKAFKEDIIKNKMTLSEAIDITKRVSFLWTKEKYANDKFLVYEIEDEMVKNVSSLSDEELNILKNCGFLEDGRYKVVKEMLLFQNGKPHFTNDYLNFLRNAYDSFDIETFGLLWYLDKRFTNIYQTSPKIRNMLENARTKIMSIINCVDIFGVEFVENVLDSCNTLESKKYVLSTLDKTYTLFRSYLLELGFDNDSFFTLIEDKELFSNNENAFSILRKNFEVVKDDYFLQKNEDEYSVVKAFNNISSKEAKKNIVEIKKNLEENREKSETILKEILSSVEFIEKIKESFNLEESTRIRTLQRFCHKLSSCGYNPFPRNNELEKMFIERYSYVPKITSFIKVLLEDSSFDIESAVDKFQRNAISSINMLGNPSLFKLTYNMNMNCLTSVEKELIVTFATGSNIDNIIRMKDFLLSKDAKSMSRDALSTIIENAEIFNLDALNKYLSIKDKKEKKLFISREVTSQKGLKRKEEFSLRCKEAYEDSYEAFLNPTSSKIKGLDILVKSLITLGSKERKLKAFILDKKDLRNFIVGDETVNCMKPNQEGEECVIESITNPYAGTFIIEDEFGRMQASAFIWVDESKDTFVFDNIEFAKDREVKTFEDILRKFIEKLPYKNVHMGMAHNQFISIGKKLKKEDFASSPIGNCYTDYHMDAKVLKKDGKVLF